jgi:hypothetical protein
MATPSAPTLEQLQARQQDLARRLAAVRGGIMGLENVGADAYVKQSGETKLEKKDLPSYTTIFNEEYSKIKDITMTVGSDAKTADENDQAFFVFNPNKTAADIAQEQVDLVKENNKLYEEQMKRSEEFLKSEGQKEKQKILDLYLTDFLNRNVNIRDGYVKSGDVGFSKAAWNSSSSRKISYETIIDPLSKRPKIVSVMSYALPAAEAQRRRELAKAVETERFKGDKSIQESFTKRYEESLLDQQKQVAKQLAKLNKKK